MARLGLEKDIKDRSVYDRTVSRFREAGILLPTFAQLADPTRIPEGIRKRLATIDPDAAHPLNLFRVHWFNDSTRRAQVAVPEHVMLPESITGVKAPIVVALGNRFPMINAHKVLAAYGCLAPRVVTGQFDPTAHRAIWPSTGNYCRGGVAISKIMGCRGVAILPERMSEERFSWLYSWVQSREDVIKTHGCESNVKEIYDECNRLDQDPANIIFNQFAEFANHLVHYLVTGRALETVFESLRATGKQSLRMAAFVSATGSAGTIAAGDHLKDRYGAKIVAVEALECPTLLYNGFGDHNIQGIGDKHIPFIHNTMNTDVVTAISDRSTDRLGVMFNNPAGRKYLAGRGVPAGVIEALDNFGLSSICNVLAAIKTAKHYDLGPDEAVFTVATDGAAMYSTERDKAMEKYFAGGFTEATAAETFSRELLGQGSEHLIECTQVDKTRMFNLGYFTWCEQQGVSIEEFQIRRNQAFWRGLRDLLPAWDKAIEELNQRTGIAAKVA